MEISISSIDSSPVPALSSAAHAAPETDRSLNQAVSRAARALNNEGYAGADREVTFSVDPATRRPVVRVVDIQTKEVVAQWPPDYVLYLAEELTGKREVLG